MMMYRLGLHWAACVRMTLRLVLTDPFPLLFVILTLPRL